MDENVEKAVEGVRRSLQANYLPTAPVHADLQTIRARLVELEAENERLDAECHLARKLAAMRGWRAERAEALLRELRLRINETRGPNAFDVVQRVDAHLSENAHG